MEQEGMTMSSGKNVPDNPVTAVHDAIRELPPEERQKAHERHQEVLEEVSSDESETVTD